jgi:ATP-dependent Clp protease, protease subunit
MFQNRLLQLLSDNRRSFVPIEQRISAVTEAATGGTEATVYLYDAIVGDRVTAEWWGGVCPQDFVPAVRALQVDTLHLRINSPGGDVFATESMCEALRDSSAHVVARIEGLCASAATTIACAADEVIISAASQYMIHQAWTMGMGNADDFDHLSALLRSCDASMIADYARRTGNTTEQLVAWCKAETWFNAQQAVDAKFADSIAVSAKAAVAADTPAAAAWNLQAFLCKPPAGASKTQADADAAAAAQADQAIARARQQQRVRALTAHPIK